MNGYSELNIAGAVFLMDTESACKIFTALSRAKRVLINRENKNYVVDDSVVVSVSNAKTWDIVTPEEKDAK